MIIPMKKVTILCLEQDKSPALEHLREMGLMQIATAEQSHTVDVAFLADSVSDAERAIRLLDTAEKPDKGKEKNCPDGKDGSWFVQRALAIDEERTSLAKEDELLRRKYEQLQPWGNFERKSIPELRAKGIYVTLCVSFASVFQDRKAGKGEKDFPAGASIHEIARVGKSVYYALVTTEDPGDVPDAVTLPEDTLSSVIKRIVKIHDLRIELAAELYSFRDKQDTVKAVFEERCGEWEFASARDGMEKVGPIAYLNGFVPEPELPRLQTAALDFGWALLIRDPAPDEFVPTCIRKPKFLNIMDPLFDFIGVQPGYHESDVNVFFLLFFPVFFGMIIGDAGYGLLFVLSALFAKFRLRGRPEAKQPLNLFLLLSFSSLIIGTLSGNWLGIPSENLPPCMRGWSLLSDPANNAFVCRLTERLGMVTPDMTPSARDLVYDGLHDKFVQYICFLLAAFHLGAARLFKFIEEIRYRWTAVEHLGWGALIVANFFMAVDLIVFPGTFPKTLGISLYAAGAVLVIITTRGAGFFNLPFSLIGSFVDVLSYIRLFAVGLAGTYIAVNFNNMGVMLLHALPKNLFILGIVFLALVALFGHILNIGLGFLSVMVHGVRLNTLEFSNHVSMQWGGTKFRPFALSERQKTNKQS